MVFFVSIGRLHDRLSRVVAVAINMSVKASEEDHTLRVHFGNPPTLPHSWRAFFDVALFF